MNSRTILVITALVAVAAGSYWLGARQASPLQVASTSAQPERKVLYYRNPMGLPDTSPVPKKDAMGMDYVAVHEGEERSTGIVSISADKVQKLGVKSEAAALRTLDKTLRASGRIEIDEQRSYTIAPKFEGWVERLFVNTTGQTVRKGQALFEVYSPELISALREQALATQGLAALKDADDEAKSGMQRLAEASASRLKNWNIDAGQMNQERLIFHAPVSGVVLEKKAVQGMRFMPGETLYQIADLSSVWVIADVPEPEIGTIKVGGKAQATVDAYPGHSFGGKVDFIYPTLNSATRTVPVRIVLANPKAMLKPAMYAQVTLSTAQNDKVLTVPASAVIDSGTRQIILVQLAAGRFEPREARLGSRSENYVEVLAGVAEGELVVTAANFLIDAESNLRAALAGLGPTQALPSVTPVIAAAPAATSTAAQHTQPAPAAAKKKPAGVGHQAQGVLEAVHADGTVSITHQPIASLGWPGMTMDFVLANSALAKDIPPGSAITFEIVERSPDVWVITKIKAAVQAPAEHQHEGH